ncbi:hypothetical protein L1987_13105 [Smallanthus sonchifolius]|uniref:Uncharacterized protein n=1 Tax=Smallanthus sonchifolius TaxID=185202 RepID=A0ACB9JFN3_9ASTR|nr:hypothetical protein L1987_13105 [Smallanthus sonchifolius]
MKKNGGRISKQNPGGNNQKSTGLAPVNNSKMKKNRTRLGGGGLSLQAFANAKSKNDGYNPSLIKKQREFYKNAKYVNKYKKSQKQPNEGQSSSQATKLAEDTSENREVGERHSRKPKKPYSLEEIYKQKQEEEQKARMEKDAIIKSKKEEKEKSEARRKAQKEKMLKKTRSGQPVMKYRIEHLLQTLQGSKN